jgi:hypothetical protein
MMNKAVNWIKANPVTVASAAVAVLALAVWMFFVPVSAQRFRQQAAESANRQFSELQRYNQQSLTVPGQSADGSPVSVRGVINPATISKLDELFGRLEQQYKDVFAAIVRFNVDSHQPMLANLFPVPATDDLPFNARRAYQQAFRQMLAEPAPGSPLPSLNAGAPPTSQALADELLKVDRDYLASLFPPKKVADLNSAERQELAQRRQQRLKDYLMRQAQSINIYAPLDITPAQTAFDVGAWAFETNQPQLADVWEGQMGLWIQQDIVRAIARTNRVGDPDSNVMNAPVKRLLKISLIPGYVGLGSGGGIAMTGAASGSTQGLAGSGGGVRAPVAAADSEPAEGESANPLAGLPTVDYSVGPTGRRTSETVLVRHAWVDVMIDSQRIMPFLDELSRANLNTVLKVHVTDVDEYEQLQRGYVLGTDDVVELRVLVESLWLTEWVLPIMPREVFEGPANRGAPGGLQIPSYSGPDSAASAPPTSPAEGTTAFHQPHPGSSDPQQLASRPLSCRLLSLEA